MRRIFITLIITCICGAASGQATSKHISGTVTDAATAQPIIGATIAVPGTAIGQISDSKGLYQLTVPAGTKEIEVSYMGYASQRINIESKTVVNAALVETVSKLDDVIAIGYGTKTKANLTGATQSISISDADMRAITSTDQLLHGKAAGLFMIQNSAQPGEESIEMRIRGVTSMDNNNTPLVIVDGVAADINSVNPRDIESISILKDASSSAIYGIEAAAGVIIITTKKGKRGVNVTYNGSLTTKVATRLPDVVEDPVLYIDIANEAFLNSGLQKKYTDATREQWRVQELATRQPQNWKKLIYDTGLLQSHDVNMSSAGDRHDITFSANHMSEDGVVFSTRAQYFSYRTKINLYFFDRKLRLSATIGGRNNTSHEAQATSSIISRYISNRPILFFKSTAGGRNIYGASAAAFAIEELGGGNDKEFNELTTTFMAVLKPVKGLTITSSYNRINSSTDLVKHIPEYEQAASVEVTVGTLKRSELTKRHDQRKNYSFYVTGNYQYEICRHKFGLTAGYEAKEKTYDMYSVGIMDLKVNKPMISAGNPNTLTASSDGNELRYLSYFGRFEYSLKDRYLFEANARYDGSSRFIKGRRYALFPSAAVAWRVSEERFMKGVKWLDNMKLRASYGILGNDNVSDMYTYRDKLGLQEYYSFGGNQVDGIGFTGIANIRTTWEKVSQLNIGLDFDFLNKISIALDWFDKESYDMLYKAIQPISLGIGLNFVPTNVGKMRNRGVEATVTYMERFRNGLRLDCSFNAGYAKNTVLDLGRGVDEIWNTTDGMIRSVVGQPFQSTYGFRYTGIYQIDNFTWQNNSDPSIPHMERNYMLKPGVTTTTLHQNLRPGDLMLYDKDGDGTISYRDVVRLGKGRSDFSYSFNIGTSYKNFDLRVLAQGQGNAYVYLQRSAPATNAFTGQIFTSFLKERWTEETPNYRMLYADKQRYEIVSSYDVHNAAYLRIKNIQAGYTFSGGFLSRIHMSSLRLYVSAENMFTFTKFPKDFDPERSVTHNTVTTYPLIKSVSAGIILNF